MNSSLVWYSRVSCFGGYPTIFSWICFTNGKLQYDGFLQYHCRQHFVSNLEREYLFRCLHFDNSCFFLQQVISPVGTVSNFPFKYKKYQLFELKLHRKPFRTISRWWLVDFFICHNSFDNSMSLLYFINLNDVWWFEYHSLNVFSAVLK